MFALVKLNRMQDQVLLDSQVYATPEEVMAVVDVVRERLEARGYVVEPWFPVPSCRSWSYWVCRWRGGPPVCYWAVRHVDDEGWLE